MTQILLAVVMGVIGAVIGAGLATFISYYMTKSALEADKKLQLKRMRFEFLSDLASQYRMLVHQYNNYPNVDHRILVQQAICLLILNSNKDMYSLQKEYLASVDRGEDGLNENGFTFLSKGLDLFSKVMEEISPDALAETTPSSQ